MKHKHLPIISAAFATALISLALGSPVSAQRTEGQINVPPVGSPLGAITDLGTSILNSTAALVDDDPYAQFRDAKYSNQGLMSEAEEIKLGDDLHIEFSKKFKYVTVGQERANRIGRQVARVSGRPGLPYKFFVMENKDLNAFAAPGGHVYITTALMKLATDAELAAVLSHEIGHLVARHSLKSLQQSQAVDSVAAVIGALTGIVGDDAGQLGSLAAKLVASPLIFAHSREQEREADFLGVNTMTKAGYEPVGMVTMLRKMQKISKTDSDLLGSFFSDHPDVPERIANTQYEIKRIEATR